MSGRSRGVRGIEPQDSVLLARLISAMSIRTRTTATACRPRAAAGGRRWRRAPCRGRTSRGYWRGSCTTRTPTGSRAGRTVPDRQPRHCDVPGATPRSSPISSKGPLLASTSANPLVRTRYAGEACAIRSPGSRNRSAAHCAIPPQPCRQENRRRGAARGDVARWSCRRTREHHLALLGHLETAVDAARWLGGHGPSAWTAAAA